MKRIVIGRGVDCDIVIPDEKDNVSRHHLVISFGLFGKMTISDTSSNGTFVNDRKLLKGASVPVTREDKVRLGSQWTLDWSLIKDPFVTTRRVLLGVAIFCLLTLICGGAWYYYKSSQPKTDGDVVIPVSKEKEQDDVWTKDSTNKIAPKDDVIKMDGQKKTPSKKKNTKKSSRSARNKSKKHNVEKIAGKKHSSENMKVKEMSSEKMPIVN